MTQPVVGSGDVTSYTNPFLCLWCKHLHGRADGDAMPVTLACAAFPDGIPDTVLDNRADHRDPIDGDNGIRFAAIDLPAGAGPALASADLDVLFTG